MLVTLQSVKENVKELQKITTAQNIKWLHVPLDGANMPFLQRKDVQNVLISNLTKLNADLHGNAEKVLIHCAAGIHRTGIFTYSLLRVQNLSPEESRKKLKDLREATLKGVQDRRLEYAEEYIIARIIKKGLIKSEETKKKEEEDKESME